MPDKNHKLPLAYPEFEKAADELFPHTTMSPEEYAAREGANWGCFSFNDYRFQNTALNVWVQRLGEVLFTPGLCDLYQKQYLTSEDIVEQQSRAEENWS